MSFVQYKKHRVFRETEDVTFYDISVEDSNASDLVVHSGPAVSPPNDIVGAKQFYIHYHQVDHNRVLSGTRTFELVNIDWKFPYHIVHLNRQSGALFLLELTIEVFLVRMDQSLSIKRFVMMSLIPRKSLSQYLLDKTLNFIIYWPMKNQ